MSRSSQNRVDSTSSAETLVGEILRWVSDSLECSSEQGHQPTHSGEWLEYNANIHNIPAATIDPLEATHYRQVIAPQTGLIHVQLYHGNSDSGNVATRPEDRRQREDVDRLTWKEFAVALILAGMAWSVFYPTFF